MIIEAEVIKTTAWSTKVLTAERLLEKSL